MDTIQKGIERVNPDQDLATGVRIGGRNEVLPGFRSEAMKSGSRDGVSRHPALIAVTLDKNHLDGYDQMAAITGKGPSTRHEIFYLGESTLGAVRIDDYKYRFIDQPGGWLGVKNHPDVPVSSTCASIRSSARPGPPT